MIRLRGLIIVCLAVAPGHGQMSVAWPAIRPLHESRTYVLAADSDTPLKALLRTVSGIPAYQLECHNGNYDDMSFINFSGDFQCVLFSLDGDHRTSWNLLASDDPSEQGSDSFNRGRMTSNQVRGECGEIPDYGRVRRFRLRGMRITFEFKNLQWTAPAEPSKARLSAFTFVLDISPEPGATSATAEKPQAPWPGAPCK